MKNMIVDSSYWEAEGVQLRLMIVSVYFLTCSKLLRLGGKVEPAVVMASVEREIMQRRFLARMMRIGVN